MEREYTICLHTPLGKRHGKLCAKIDGRNVIGWLSMLNYTLPFSGIVQENGECVLNGTFLALVRTVSRLARGRISDTAVDTAKGRISDTKVDLELNGDRNRFLLSGSACPAKGGRV